MTSLGAESAYDVSWRQQVHMTSVGARKHMTSVGAKEHMMALGAETEMKSVREETITSHDPSILTAYLSPHYDGAGAIVLVQLI